MVAGGARGTENEVQKKKKAFACLKKYLKQMYTASNVKSYLFSTGESIRASGGAGSWRRAVLANIEKSSRDVRFFRAVLVERFCSAAILGQFKPSKGDTCASSATT